MTAHYEASYTIDIGGGDRPLQASVFATGGEIYAGAVFTRLDEELTYHIWIARDSDGWLVEDTALAVTRWATFLSALDHLLTCVSDDLVEHVYGTARARGELEG